NHLVAPRRPVVDMHVACRIANRADCRQQSLGVQLLSERHKQSWLACYVAGVGLVHMFWRGRGSGARGLACKPDRWPLTSDPFFRLSSNSVSATATEPSAADLSRRTAGTMSNVPL